ncbi:MAG: FAD-dependent oxidoreductase, partial [Planctomycetales bacterium]|nr:FAD-dependent oxidoreductase [Planctomycetales bacterium]
LREFEELAPQHGHTCELLSPAEVSQRTPAANAEGLRGGLWSAFELGVNPRQASAALAGWLSTQGVELAFGRAVTVVEPRGDCQVRLRLAGERADRVFDRVVVCSGADFETLIPDHFAESGMRRCKLQMLRTRPQSGGWRLGTHLASGLTLRHYANFTCCPTLGEVRRRIAAEAPELDEHGIHVMASQDDEGHVILGDSHEYGDRVTPFDSEEINALMLRELRKVFVLPDWSIDQAWHGVYAKRDAGPDEEPVHESSPFPGAYICTGVGGAGMTLSFGLAERAWRAWTSR